VLLDAVVVAYNSSSTLRSCVEPLARENDLNVIVVDNASPDESVSTVADLPLTVVESKTNLGFSGGCNLGWRRGQAPYVMFLNPDAAVEPAHVRLLVASLDDRSIGLAAPKILDIHGQIEHSQHHFPNLTAAFLRALFLDRVLGGAARRGDVVDAAAYEQRERPDWVGGACIVLRRETLEQLDGFDERFFMYSEDMDLCWRLRRRGLAVQYVPEAVVKHHGGTSAPAPRRNGLLMQSRVLYARKNASRPAYAFYVAAYVLGLLVRLALDRSHRDLHVEGLRGVMRGLRGPAPR
jgi:GT2 family glycosyltransferase